MDRVAVILHGIVSGDKARNGIGDPIDIVACAKLIKHNLLSSCEYDVFMHSWSTEHEALLKELYNPVMSLFQPQEFFGYDLTNEDLQNEERTHTFRTVSRYESLERAMKLKAQYEREHDVSYKWVLVLRYDLVVLNKLDFTDLNPEFFYICQEPHWPDPQHFYMIHDIVFLSGDRNMVQFAKIASDIRRGEYKDLLATAHILAHSKLTKILPDVSHIAFLCKRFVDMDIYRFVVNPDLNELGKQYGGLETGPRMRKLLDEING